MARRVLLSGVLIAALMTACQGAPAPSGAKAPTRAARTPATPAPSAPVVDPGAGAAPIIGNNGGGIISDNGASLIGQVRIPSGLIGQVRLIGNNGAGIIGNNGGNIIGNNGGGLIGQVRSYGLLAEPEQVPLPNAPIAFFDAKGAAILDKDGQPLTAVTDAQGRYGVAAQLGADNWLARVELGPELGALQAIVPKAGDKRTADLDLVSTLTTGYIMTEYVQSQAADRQATLNKLPPEVEAETRAKATAALAGGTSAVPENFATETVVATINGLRERDPAFDLQMDTVRRLLIAAGQADFGAGRPGTEVALSTVRSLALQPDGTLFINCAFDRRVWRLQADGKLVTAAGNGANQPGAAAIPPDVAPIAGLKGPDAPLIAVRGIAADPQGRVIVLEYESDFGALLNVGDYSMNGIKGLGRVSRLELDGTVTTLWEASGTGRLAVAGVGGEVLVLTVGVGPEAAALWAIAPDKTRSLRHTFSAADTEILRRAEAYGRDALGRLYVGLSRRSAQQVEAAVHRFDPATEKLERVLDVGADGLAGLALDTAGNAFYVKTGSERLVARRPDGSERILMEKVPQGFAPSMFGGVALAPDGTAYFRNEPGMVYRLKDGVVTRVAGSAGSSTGTATDVALVLPWGLAVGPGGTLYVGDKGAHQVLKIGADRTAAPVGGNKTGAYAEASAGAAGALSSPRSLGVDSQGRVFVSERHPFFNAIDFSDTAGSIEGLCLAGQTPMSRIRRLDPGGTAAIAFTSDDRVIFDVVVSSTDDLYAVLLDACNHKSSLVKVAADGTATTVIAENAGHRYLAAACAGPDGVIYVAADGKLLRHTPGAGTVEVEPRSFPNAMYYSGAMACDAAGRIYMATRINGIVRRYDPATKTFSVVAGAGTENFGGQTVNDGLKDPRSLAFGPDGTLYIADAGYKQVKRVAADQLTGVPE